MSDANLTYHLPRNRISVEAWVRNIENSPVLTYGQTLGAYTYGILPPRTYGLTLAAKF